MWNQNFWQGCYGENLPVRRPGCDQLKADYDSNTWCNGLERAQFETGTEREKKKEGGGGVFTRPQAPANVNHIRNNDNVTSSRAVFHHCGSFVRQIKVDGIMVKLVYSDVIYS